MERSPVLRFQLNDSDSVGFGLAEIIVSPGFRSPPRLVAPGGEGANDSGLVPFLDNAGGGLRFHFVPGDKSKVVFYVPPIS